MIEDPNVTRIEATGVNGHGQVVRLETHVPPCEPFRLLVAECPKTYTWRAIPPSPKENR